MARANRDRADIVTIVSRRRFLELSGAGSLVVLSGSIGCTTDRPDRDGSTSAARTDHGNVPPFELDELSIDDLRQAMEQGRRSSVELTELYLRRIEAIDRAGPTLRSVIETNPDARDIAASLDDERRSGTVRGALHGIPILLKDNIATADRMTTTAGSLALEGSIAPVDSFVARRLRESGAVLLGKANLSEWANFRSTRSSSGWSARGGQCRNPYTLDRNPCGSSSGSAAAVAASLAAAAIGTETNGSIVCPSSANGVVGIKPTVGLVSRSRIIPISPSQDTAGPMARTVRDAAIVLGAIAGVDPDDPATSAATDHVHADYTAFLDSDGLRGARIGIARQFFEFHERVDALVEDALEAMRSAGAELVDPVELPDPGEIGASSYEVLLYEFKAAIADYLEGLGPETKVRSLADLIAFNEAHRDREMRFFEQEVFLAAEDKGPLTDPEYVEALERCRTLARGIDAIVDEHRLDAIVAPTGGPAWVTDPVNGDHFGGGSSTPAAVAGYPNITVPAGVVHGLPVGVSFFGPAWSESELLRVAYAFEQATGHRRRPEFHATLSGAVG